MISKYDIKIGYFTQVNMSEGVVDKWQDDGWEICGAVGVSQNIQWCGDVSVTIPFRRKKKSKRKTKFLFFR